ncbi:hypothetical protein ABZP36_028440 [Zizania latifolia]
MQPDPSGNANANAKAKMPPPVTAPATGRPVSVLPHKTVNVRDHYGISKKLGQGQFGTMYQCVDKVDGAEYAWLLPGARGRPSSPAAYYRPHVVRPWYNDDSMYIWA